MIQPNLTFKIVLRDVADDPMDFDPPRIKEFLKEVFLAIDVELVSIEEIKEIKEETK